MKRASEKKNLRKKSLKQPELMIQSRWRLTDSSLEPRGDLGPAPLEWYLTVYKAFLLQLL